MSTTPSDDRITEAVRRLVDDRGVPGAVAGLITADGIRFRAGGVCARGGTQTVGEADQWHIGSCGKAITAALYARLVELGRARRGASLAELFADCGGAIAAGWEERTVDEVLHCRAGIAANLSRAQMRRAFADDRPLVDRRTDAAVYALGRPPASPGRFVYSNLGYVLVGAAIDRIAGTSYEAALAEHLLRPLGITSLGFGPPPRVWGHRPRIQLGSLCLGRGVPADPTVVTSDNPPVLSSAGTMHLSVTDWARFLRLFLRPDGHGLLAPATVEHLLAVPSGKGAPMAMGWARADRLAGVSFGMQGSNTCWAASALLDVERERVAFAIANDGRTRILTATASLAAGLLGPDRE